MIADISISAVDVMSIGIPPGVGWVKGIGGTFGSFGDECSIFVDILDVQSADGFNSSKQSVGFASFDLLFLVSGDHLRCPFGFQIGYVKGIPHEGAEWLWVDWCHVGKLVFWCDGICVPISSEITAPGLSVLYVIGAEIIRADVLIFHDVAGGDGLDEGGVIVILSAYMGRDLLFYVASGDIMPLK